MRVLVEHTQSASLPTAGICGEVRAGRFHYQLRCCLPHGHGGEHRWTPELVPFEISS
jgi:hypothetical protein